MDPRFLQACCRTADFASVEATLREWKNVDAVGSFREKQNNKKDITTVFITFKTAEDAAAAAPQLRNIPGLLANEANSENKGPSTKSTSKKSKNLAAEFLKYESVEEHEAPKERSRKGKANRRAAHDEQRGRNEREDRSIRGGRAGRGRGRGRGQGGFQARGRRHYYQRLPPVEANVAFVDNVPFGTTNDHIMDVFSKYGRVLDVNRLELMVMICYDNPESVQQCIQHTNGTKINGNIITVSSGTVRIPGGIAAQIGI